MNNDEQKTKNIWLKHRREPVKPPRALSSGTKVCNSRTRLIGPLFAKGLGRDTRYLLLSPRSVFGVPGCWGVYFAELICAAIRLRGRGCPVPLMGGVPAPSGPVLL